MRQPPAGPLLSRLKSVISVGGMKTLITAIVLRALGAASSVPYPTVHELKDSVSTPAPGNPGAKR